MTKATSSSWQYKPMEKPSSATWQGDISARDLAKLVDGVIPRAMEDKWFIYADAADGQGRVAIHFCRSWTGAEVVLLNIVVSLDAAGSVDMDAPARVSGVTWESRGQDETEAKLLVRDLCSDLLGCDFARQL
ncbi:uncharacterized protein G6M90_00g061490 [Metarhizium brunneum]|uniref:Uncharacterized protein n=1 Tax=Metarhizium brunneum TaxID=500148 RepID=A0A7D5YTB3_9HYPO